MSQTPTPSASYLVKGEASSLPKPHELAAMQQELQTILTQAAVFDLADRALLSVRGSDQVRWLNGMITNTVKDLPAGHTNYSFVLNAQGRIQGDVTTWRFADHLLLETGGSQAEHLFAHFDHFIIMDDVELEMVHGRSAIGVAGPQAAAALARAGLTAPREPETFLEQDHAGHSLLVSYEYSPVVPRFVIWGPEAAIPALRQAIAPSAPLASPHAVHALRLLEGTPLYGVDFTERSLAQEVDPTRPLHFSKGCYLGQEIVERIRSRATVHRRLRQVELEGTVPSPRPGSPMAVTAEGQPAGEITSVAEIDIPPGCRVLALATLKNEPIERGQTLTYEGGTVRVLTPADAAQIRQSFQETIALN